MLLLAERTEEATRRAILFAREVFKATGVAFYKVDPALRAYDYSLDNVPDEFHRRYVEEMGRLDPLHVSRLSERSTPIGHFAIGGPGPCESGEAEYWRFFEYFGLAETIELVFSHEGRIHAGMSLTWSGSGGQAAASVGMAEAVRDYLEFTLKPAPLPAERFGLTGREKEVVELLCCGRTNVDIGAILGIGLATVKTHLVHIFDKLGVENRAAAVAMLTRR